MKRTDETKEMVKWTDGTKKRTDGTKETKQRTGRTKETKKRTHEQDRQLAADLQDLLDDAQHRDQKVAAAILLIVEQAKSSPGLVGALATVIDFAVREQRDQRRAR